MIADQNGLLSAQTASAAIFTTQQVVSTAGQTSFPITNGYSTGYVTVFVNGTKLSADEYVDTSGTNIIFLTGSNSGDVVEFQKYLPAAGVSNNTLRTVNYFTTTLGQTNFTVNYTPGLIDVFYNGAKLDNTEYTAANGTSITLATGSNAGDRLEVDVYSYQVGAFSGIGGTGAANQLAYFNTSNSITGSNAFTVSGSAIIITGSLIVSGSGTLINIGPAVFSGSVTSTAGFSGSFSGNADSASLAQNSLLLQGTGSIGFATTASLLAVSSSQQQISSSLLTLTASFTALSSSYTALSGSYNTFSGSESTRITKIENNYATTGSNSFRADQSITGSLVVSSTITAQTLVVQTVTSSILYSSGSNVFGNQLANTQTFTGSIQASGSSSHFLMGGSVGIGITNPTRPLQINAAADTRVVITDSNVSTTAGLYIRQFGSASAIVNNSNGTFQLATNDTYFLTANVSGQVGIGTTQPSYTLDVAGTGRFTSQLIASSTSGGTAAIFQNTGAQNSNGIELRGGTTGTTVNWKIEKDNTVSNAFQLTPSTANGGTTYTTPVLTIASTGAATFNSTVISADTLTVNKAKAGSGVENLNALVLRITGTGAIGDGANIAFNNTNNTSVAFITGITGGDNVAYGSISFSTRNYSTDSIVEVMRINNRGYVGIGTTSPACALDIGGTESTTIRAGSWAIMENVTTNQAMFGRNVTYNSIGGSGWRSINTGYATGIRMNDDFGDGSIVFYTNPSTTGGTSLTNWDTSGPKFIVRNGGNVGIGTTNPSYLLHIPQGNNLFLSNLYITGTASNPILSSGATGGSMYLQGGGAGEGNIYLQGAGSGGNGYIEFRTNGSLRMTISSGGNIGAPSGTNIYNASDARLKQNITTITNGLDKVMGLNPVKFNWINNFVESEEGKDMLGFVAQEVQTIIPEAVENFSGNSITVGETTIENPLRVNEKFIIPVLVKAIQELQEKLQRNNIN